MDIVQELKALSQKITQEKMAQEIGVSVSTVNRWLKGHHVPMKHVIPAIERFLASQK